MDTLGSLAKFQRRGLGADPSGHPFRRRRHAPVAAVARVVSQAASQACVRADDAAGHRGTRTERRRLCRTAAGLQRGSPVSGRRPAAADRHQAPGHPARAARPQHRAGDRRRRPVAAGARSRCADAGPAVGPRHRLAGRLPSRRHARHRRGAGRPAGHLRRQAEPCRDRLWLHPERRAGRRRRRRVLRSTASSRSRTTRRPSVSSTAAPSSGTAASSC